MDPFEVRMQFLSLIRKLNASQQSIQKVVGFALKFFSQCGEDLWDCIVEECQKGSINNRINILYFLDSLCEASLLAKSHPRATGQGLKPDSSFYVDYISRDLSKIVGYVVPEGRIGLPNLMSTKQILEDWRSKRVIDPQKVDDALPPPSPLAHAPSRQEALPRDEIFKRIEADRERHKRLRERRWVQPATHAPTHAAPLASFMPLTDDADGAEELTFDIEFENEWETTSDWNEDDDEAVAEENDLCYPKSTSRTDALMDIS
ncbi:CTD kinase subunit gamma CTK3-domain-containing protein [Multifurca ochricompacta]|uniref:CTD kinase subunit gamma CTK3-domain-containing protein n=1 Tax=Multifurca ochricompacta TaxID=376703 RepID=A0AAD4M5V5_9AGAM|nr:CTD kinase subunit gamma CTK3-domain-containing protein [Multifurca ochricompacta]